MNETVHIKSSGVFTQALGLEALLPIESINQPELKKAQSSPRPTYYTFQMQIPSRLVQHSSPLLPLASGSSQWRASISNNAQALLISIKGVNVQDSQVLRRTNRDAKRLKTCLVDIFGYKPWHVVHMSDVAYPPSHPLYPSKENILQQIVLLGQGLYHDDRAFFWYSGHGEKMEEKPWLFDDCAGYGIVSADGDIVSGCDLTQALMNSIPEDVQLTTLFDCCYAPFILSFPHYQCNRFMNQILLAPSIATRQRSHSHGLNMGTQRPYVARRGAYQPIRKSLPSRRSTIIAQMPTAVPILEDTRQMAMSPELMLCDGTSRCQPIPEGTRYMIKISLAIDLAFESPNRETMTSIFLSVLRTSHEKNQHPTFKVVLDRVNKRANEIYGQLIRDKRMQTLDLDSHCPMYEQVMMVSSISPLGERMDKAFQL